MTSLRWRSSATLMALLASTAMAEGPRSTQSAPDMGVLQAGRTANEVVGLDGPATQRPGGHFDWEYVSAEQRASALPVDESSSPFWGLAVFASAVLMFVLTAVGMTLAYRSLRAEMRRKRIPYRPRGPHTTREPA